MAVVAVTEPVVVAAAVVAAEPAASAEWPATQPIGAIDYADYSHMPTQPAVVIPRARPASVMPVATTPSTVIPVPVATTPSTVIPVPALPTMRSTGLARRLEPVVRSAPAQKSASSRRFAKGTGPVDPATTQDMAAVSEDMTADMTADMAVGDKTRPGIAMPAEARTTRTTKVPSQVGDQTRVGIAMPQAARTVALPSGKHRTSSR